MSINERKIDEIIDEIKIFYHYMKLYISSLIREKLGIYKNEPPKNSLRHDVWQLVKKKIKLYK